MAKGIGEIRKVEEKSEEVVRYYKTQDGQETGWGKIAAYGREKTGQWVEKCIGYKGDRGERRRRKVEGGSG